MSNYSCACICSKIPNDSHTPHTAELLSKCLHLSTESIQASIQPYNPELSLLLCQPRQGWSIGTLELWQGRLGVSKTARCSYTDFIQVQPSGLVFGSMGEGNTVNEEREIRRSERVRCRGRGDRSQAFLDPNPTPALIKSCAMSLFNFLEAQLSYLWNGGNHTSLCR